MSVCPNCKAEVCEYCHKSKCPTEERCDKQEIARLMRELLLLGREVARLKQPHFGPTNPPNLFLGTSNWGKPLRTTCIFTPPGGQITWTTPTEFAIYPTSTTKGIF